MITLENSFEGKITYVVGHYFANGCQIGHLDTLEDVVKSFNVSLEQLNKLYYKMLQNPDKWGDNEDWDEAIKHRSTWVRIICAKSGKCLDTLIKDHHWLVRAQVACSGYGLDILKDDKHPVVRAAVLSRTQSDLSNEKYNEFIMANFTNI